MSQPNDLLEVLYRIKDSVIALDCNGTITYVNQASIELLGASASQQALGKNVWELLPNLVGTEAYNKITEAIEKKEPQRFEWKGVYTDRYWETSVFPSEAGVTAITRDISERKKNEDALFKAKTQTERERKRLEAILETLPSAVVIVEASDGKISYANKRALNLFGFTFAGNNSDAYITKVKAFKLDSTPFPYEETPVSYSLKSGQEKSSVEMLIQKPDEAKVSMLVSSTPLRDCEGKITAAVVFFEDNTERRNAEQDLKKLNALLEDRVQKRTQEVTVERERLYTVLESLPVMICLLNSDYHITFSNRAFKEKFGESDDRRCYEFCYGQTGPCSFCETYRVLETGESHHWITKKDESVIEIYAFPVTDVDGSKIILEMGIDITDRIRLEKQLKDSERLAAIGATAGMVGHDIRNPLQAMISDVYLLKCELTKMPSGEVKMDVGESLDSIEKNIGYINKIVADLQDYARQLVPDYTLVELSDLLVSVFETVAVPESIMLKVNIRECPKFKTDQTFIRRTLTNLVNNAIQAMPNGGKLELNGYKKDSKLYISVSDTGVGIPDEVKPKLFTPMMTTKSRGQGLGLAVTKRLIEALNGTIKFESQEGKGTKFIIELPLKD